MQNGNTTLDCLLDQVLPELLTHLDNCRSELESVSAPQVAKIIAKTIPLLQDLQKAAGVSQANSSDNVAARNYRSLLNPSSQKPIQPSNEMSDDEAFAALSAMDEPHSAEDEMSDEEAMAAMAAMEDEPEIPASSKQNDESSELSDEEAEALLRGMDSEEMSDEEAKLALAAMDASEPEESGEMSDDEAQMLLENMDSPNGSEVSSNELSDEEAKKLLAAMDGDEGSFALEEEDESLALLEKLGGGDEKAPKPREQENTTHGHPKTASEPTEIPEWSPNDFQTDPDMVADFLNNSQELMETLDESILKLESQPQDKEIIEEIFRAAHTLKGAGGMFGFSALERVMHGMENLFDLIRKDKLIPNSDIIDVVFEGLDLLRTLIEAVKDGKPCGVKTGNVVKNLELVATGKSVGKKPSTPSNSKTEKDDSSPKPKSKEETSTIRVDLKKLDILVNLVGELVIDRTRFVSIEEELRTNHPQIKLTGSFSETVQLFGRHMNEIQDIIMKVRMVPIGNAFNKFTRIVRDLSKSLGKKIDLVITGESAELDKTLVEQIGDPLIHLIRNSCDHGVEGIADREAAGKEPTGHIYLSAIQEGNHIVIKIEDDGKGIDAEIIRKKGIEKGLITEDQELSNRDIYNLIFEPGFSTAEKVTNISGRGVGMDVVKKQIMKLKGLLEIDSELGQGTCITIRLPLTLAIVQSLLVEAKNETFAIPLGSVIESIRISKDEIQKVGEAEVIKLRDNVLPLMHLEETLTLGHKGESLSQFIKEQREIPRRITKKSERYYVVVVGTADRPFGIVVDKLLNQQEMVIKSLGHLLKEVPCVAGGAVLGHGEVVLVLDIAELDYTFRAKSRRVPQKEIVS